MPVLVAAVLSGAFAGVWWWRDGRTAQYRDAGRPPALPASISWIVVPLAAAVSGLVAFFQQDLSWVVLDAGLAAVSCIVSWTDLDVHKIPNRAMAPAGLVLGIGVGVAAWWQQRPGIMLWALLCAAAVGAVYLVAALFSPLGMGDVKLATVGALGVGAHGWQPVLWAQIVALLLALFAGVVELVRTRDRHALVPLAPALAMGSVIALIMAGQVG